MKLAGARVERFVKSPDPDARIILLYGPDRGLVSARAQSLQTHYLGGPPGPFSQSLLFDAALKGDPAALSDAVCARALDGSKSVVRLKTQGDQATRAVVALLAGIEEGAITPAALLLIEAGDLAKRSKLRQCIEQADALAVALPCYLPDRSALRALALDAAQAEGLRFDDDALEALLDRLPQNSALAAMEMEKLVLYAGPQKATTITVDDVVACITGNTESSTDALAFAIAAGDPQRASLLLRDALEAGQTPVGLLRAIQRHFWRLGEARAAMATGKTAKTAMASLRPPVFYAQSHAFARQMQSWPGAALDRALALCLHTERAMKTSGAAAENLLAQLLLRLSTAPPQPHGRAGRH